MVTFEEAQKLIAQNNPPSKKEEIFVSAALGCVSARDIRSPLDLPLYDNSAMDGFVFRSEDTSGATAERPIFLNICGVIKAGDNGVARCAKQDTYRIMTGAPVIKGSDTVLEKEKAVIRDDRLVIDAPVPKGRNVRFKGEEIKKRERVLPKDSVINPGTIGFLATMGMDKISVFRKPAVSLIATGSELTVPGSPLRPGKIYDSNTAMIQAALQEMRVRPTLIRRVNDDPKIIQKVVHFALRESDIVILMGGVSSGDYDFVKEILQKADVQTIFWGVKQKPGKPLYFGRKKEHLVFGLPGNPASVFTCFYEYVYPAIRRFMGHANPYLRSEERPLCETLQPDPTKYLFIKAKTGCTEESGVHPLKRQKSHMISSLCETNSFVVVPNSETVLEKGQRVLVHSLPVQP